jgi:ABC transporter, phosphonate, periplasmic substrate-binding protein
VQAGKKNKIGAIYFIIIIVLFVFSNAIAQDNTITINLVISNDIIGDVNKSDASAAMDVWLGGMMNEISQNVKILPDIIDSFDEIKERIYEKKADVIGLLAIDYIQNISELPITPLFIIQRNKKPGLNYLLITNKNSEINSLSDLKSKTILTGFNRDNEITEKWLFVEMKKKDVSNPSDIINNFIKVKKPTKRLFQVFLGNADGCVMSAPQYESMCELNPQLRHQLKILVQSPTYLTAVYFVNNLTQKEGIGDVREHVQELNRTMNGSQMLKLFQAFKVSYFEQSQLESLENLFQEYKMYTSENGN